MIFSSLRTSFVLLKQRIGTVALFVCVSSFFSFLVSMGNALVDVVQWGAVAFLVLLALDVIVSFRMLAMLLADIASEQPLSIRAAWVASKHHAGKLFLITIGYLLVVLGSTVLLIIPGFICAALFAFAPYLLVAEGEHNVSAAFWKSAEYVRGRFWHILLRVLVIGVALYCVHLFYYILELYVFTVFPNLYSLLGVIIFELVLDACIAALIFSYVYVLYQSTKAVHGPLTTPVTTIEKVLLRLWAVLGIIAAFALPVVLAAYNIGVQQHTLRAYEARYLPFGAQANTRTYVSHLFGVMFNYPSSWSDSGTAQTFSSDPTIIAYLTHNDVGGYTKRFILRKFNTKETIQQFKVGYEETIKKQGNTLADERIAGGTYSAVVVTDIPAQGTAPAYKETHYVVAFPASVYGSTGLFTVDYYDTANAYLTNFSTLFGIISETMKGKVPAYIPSTHDGR